MEITEQCDPGRQSPPRSRHLRPGALIFIYSLDDSVYAETAEAEQGTGHVIREQMLAHVALKVCIVSTEDIALHTQLEEGETQVWRFLLQTMKSSMGGVEGKSKQGRQGVYSFPQGFHFSLLDLIFQGLAYARE